MGAAYRRGVIVAAVACALGAGARARAQRIETKRARTIIVGTPPGAAPAERVDAARSGASRDLLPTGPLHVAWRRNLGFALEAAPLVDGRGDVILVAASGKVVVLAPDGEERSHTVVGAAATSSASLTSDGTAVFMTSLGEAVGVHLGAVRFRTRLGGGRSTVAPLALDDGGFVVATPSELVSLDGEGNVRARAPLDTGTPPLELLGARSPPCGPRCDGTTDTPDSLTVYAVFAQTGDVYSWFPASGRQPSRVGTFGGSVDGNAALAADGSLVAIVDGARLVALDPAHATPSIRAATATTGAIAFLGPPATHGGVVTFFALTASRTVAIGLDASGNESLRQSIAPSPLPAFADGGLSRSAIPAHVGPLVDPRGDIAFALPTGEVGTVAPSGAVDLVSEVCARFVASSALATLSAHVGPTFAGIAPAAPAAMVVTCGSGVVARIDSDFAHAP